MVARTPLGGLELTFPNLEHTTFFISPEVERSGSIQKVLYWLLTLIKVPSLTLTTSRTFES
jgi:hypothetical protein